jgi:hypothetical protein
MLQRVIQKLRRTYFQSRHARAAAKILETAPLAVGVFPFTVLSMVHHRDVMSYLVAVKSFAMYANPKRVVVVCDASITDTDRQILKSQVPHLELRNADEFTHEDIPRGGTWERLYAISEYARNDYVVQLDADTITLQSPTEVITAIKDRSGFVIGEKADQDILSLADMAAWSNRFHAGLNGIQCVVEASIDTLGLTGTHYVRGCSGFTGFPPSESMRINMLAFSKAMKQKHKARWSEWSTEQITSNYLVANMHGTKVLPFPLYGTPDVLDASSIFMHFMGYLRFTTGKYSASTDDVVGRLKAPKRDQYGKRVDALSLNSPRL